MAAMKYLRKYERELVCQRCRSVIAWVTLGLWRLMSIRDVHGNDITPLSGNTAMDVARTRLADARRAEAAGDPKALDQYRGVVASERALAYLKAEAGEVMYEVVCPSCRAVYLRSLVHLVALVRNAPAGRVVLGE